MPTPSYLLSVLVFVIVWLGWMVLGGAFFLLQRPAGAIESKREPASLIGFAMQLSGIALVWLARRPWFTPLWQGNLALEILLAVIAIAAAIFSAWMMIAAIRVLGKQWSLTARVIKDHELITGGPYQIVRHPIYTALLTMILATGLAQSCWWSLPGAILMYLAGTLIRIRSEEKLLRELFGATYEEFARRVPALIPGLY